MNRIELQEVLTALRNRVVELDAVRVGCPTCLQWEARRCRLADAVPPAEIVQDGCPSWEWDSLPF